MTSSLGLFQYCSELYYPSTPHNLPIFFIFLPYPPKADPLPQHPLVSSHIASRSSSPISWPFLFPFYFPFALLIPFCPLFSLLSSMSLQIFFPFLFHFFLLLSLFLFLLQHPPSPSGLEIDTRFPHPTFFLPPKKWKRCQKAREFLFWVGVSLSQHVFMSYLPA